AQEGSRNGEARNYSARLNTNEMDDSEGDPAVKTPSRHRDRYDESAEEEKDERIGVGRRGLADVGDPEERKQREGQEGGGGDGNGFRHPPDRHECTDGCRPPGWD